MFLAMLKFDVTDLKNSSENDEIMTEMTPPSEGNVKSFAMPRVGRTNSLPRYVKLR